VRKYSVAVAVTLILGALSSPSSAGRPLAQGKRLTSNEFRVLLERLAAGWNEGDSRKAADCFTQDAVYTEPPDKQEYRGRQRLYEFFGGAQGRRGQMRMQWHHVAFDEATQVGMGEFTFEYGGRVHGVTVVRVRDGLISNWREYFYASTLSWDEFTKRNPF
jgi:ketosteroid isomerase-like protein